MRKRTAYWLMQVGGWGLYLLITSLWTQLLGKEVNTGGFITLASVFVLGIAVSHLYREVIIRLDWLRFNIGPLIPRVLVASVSFGLFMHLLQTAIGAMTQPSLPDIASPVYHVQGIIIWTPIFMIWSLIYFAFHYFRNYRKEEIKNLQWEARKNEIELNKLKSQLNPHFIFNSMNSIRALVDEDPKKAKRSITQLSNILRNTLTMGKKELIPFEEEMAIVRDYLELEGARYEERLNVEYDIDPNSNRFQVPPLMLQTLVENGIKHGISKLTEGGTLRLQTQSQNGLLKITIRNSGSYHLNGSNGTGFGLDSTRQRLEILYGPAGKFHIDNSGNNEVMAELEIPQQTMMK